MKQLQLQV